MMGTYLVICYGASLQGNESLYTEGSALVEIISFGKNQQEIDAHACIPLLGRFKTEIGEDKHVAVIANVTKSGIQVQRWVEHLVWVLVYKKKHNIAGPVFCNPDGTMIRAFQLNGEFHSALKDV